MCGLFHSSETKGDKTKECLTGPLGRNLVVITTMTDSAAGATDLSEIKFKGRQNRVRPVRDFLSRRKNCNGDTC